jgi:hypothetical protein
MLVLLTQAVTTVFAFGVVDTRSLPGLAIKYVETHYHSVMLSGKLLKTGRRSYAQKTSRQGNPPEIKDDIATVSSIATIPAETIQQWHLQAADTVSVKFVLELDVKKLAKFIEKQGAPPKGGSWPDWASNLAQALAKQGLKESVTKGVDILLDQ